MATRMQQRRGTEAQWTAADPVLAAGEIGFETDTNQFKIGDGVNLWSALSYFKNLEDLGGSLDDYIPITQKAAPLGVATLNSDGNIPISQLGALIQNAPDALNTLNEIADAILALNAHAEDTTGVHGIADTANLVKTVDMDNAIEAHRADTTNVHGIANTALLATTLDVETARGEAYTFATGEVSTHNDDTEGVHGIANTALLITTTGLASAIEDHNDATTTVHGIADTSLLETISGAQDKADAAEAAAILAAAGAADDKIGVHNLDTTNVHGIADTSALALTADVNSALDLKQDKVTGVSDTEIGYLDGVTSAIQTQIDGKAASSHTHAQSDITNLTTDLAAKAPLASPTFTGTVTASDVTISGNLTVEGTTTTVNATDLVVSDPLIYVGEGNSANLVDLGIVSSFNNGTYQHSGIVRDSSAGKWKFFKGVTDEPTTTINFAQGSLDDLAVNNVEVAGVVFTDGTQTKAGVPSITAFATAISSSATLAAGEQDKFVPLTGAVTITLPATGYSTGQSIDFYQASGTGAQFASTNSVVGTPGLKFRTTYSVVTAMKTASGWLVFGDLSA